MGNPSTVRSPTRSSAGADGRQLVAGSLVRGWTPLADATKIWECGRPNLGGETCMLAEWQHRRLAATLGAMLLGAGCASAPARATRDAQFVESSRENECEQSARTASGRTATWADVAGSSVFATLLGALQGALEGATSSTWRGTRAGRDSWIGAAAGAGVGMISGTVAGIRRVREAQAVYLVAYQSCIVEAPPPTDPALLADGELPDVGTPTPAYVGPPLRP